MLEVLTETYNGLILAICAAGIGYGAHLLKTYFFREKDNFKEDVREIKREFMHLEQRFEEVATTVDHKVDNLFKMNESKFDGLAQMMTELTNLWSKNAVHSEYTKEKVVEIDERLKKVESKIFKNASK